MGAGCGRTRPACWEGARSWVARGGSSAFSGEGGLRGVAPAYGERSLWARPRWGETKKPVSQGPLGEGSPKGRPSLEEGLCDSACLLGKGLPEGLGLHPLEAPGSPALE